MLARFAKEAVSGLGLRCAPALGDSSALLRSLASRGYATGAGGGLIGAGQGMRGPGGGGASG